MATGRADRTEPCLRVGVDLIGRAPGRLATGDAFAGARESALDLLVPPASHLVGREGGGAFLERALERIGQAGPLIGRQPKGLFEDRLGLGAHASRIAEKVAAGSAVFGAQAPRSPQAALPQQAFHFCIEPHRHRSLRPGGLGLIRTTSRADG